MPMRREARLTASKDFREVYDRGRSAANKDLVVYALKRDGQRTRVGFSVSRKLGSAVTRNRIRRLLREAFQKNERAVAGGYDIVFIARHAIKGKSFHDAEKAFIDVLGKAGLLRGIEDNDEKINDSTD